jgi:lipopolysaccharide transport system ATP-binding protein
METQGSGSVAVRGLGKRYWIGARPPASTLRERLAGLATGAWRRAAAAEEFWALRDVSVDVKPGEVVGIVGPNGAGKSTLLKILSRITPPTEGVAELRGRVSSLLEVGTGFHPDLTGRENVFLNGAILGMRLAEIRRRFDAIVAFAELEAFVDTPVKRYSSGMIVRLAFSVAAHLEPDVLIVDEVLAVGDLRFQRRCLGRLEDLRGQGRTVLFVSHDLASIRQLCTRALLLVSGRLVEDGAPEAVTRRYERPGSDGAPEATGVAERPSPPRGYHLHRAELRRAGGERSARFRAGEVMELHLWASGAAPEGAFTVEFKLRNGAGAVISFGAANPVTDTYFRAEERHFVCRLGPLPLTEGDYTFDFTVRVWNRERWDFWDRAIGFQVTRCDLFATGYSVSGSHDGDFVIPQQWRAGP